MSPLTFRPRFLTLRIFVLSDLLNILAKLDAALILHKFLNIWKLFWRKVISLCFYLSYFHFQLLLFLLKSVEVDRGLKYIIVLVKLFIRKKDLKNSIWKLDKYFGLLFLRNFYRWNLYIDNFIVQRWFLLLVLNIKLGFLGFSCLPNLFQSMRMMIQKSQETFCFLLCGRILY